MEAFPQKRATAHFLSDRNSLSFSLSRSQNFPYVTAKTDNLDPQKLTTKSINRSQTVHRDFSSIHPKHYSNAPLNIHLKYTYALQSNLSIQSRFTIIDFH